MHGRDDDLVASCDGLAREEVRVRPANLLDLDLELRGDRLEVFACCNGVDDRLVIDRRRRRNRHGLDDRGVPAERDVAILAAVADDHRLGVYRPKARGQICWEMAIHRRVARHCYRYSENDGMRQVSINSQVPTPKL